jgi:hypothetical protein
VHVVDLQLRIYCIETFLNILYILGPKRGAVSGLFVVLHNKELRYLYRSLSIDRAAKLRRLQWAGHVEA